MSDDRRDSDERTMVWPTGYALGIPMIDEHHRILFSLFDRLGQGLRDGMGEDDLGAIIGELLDYANMHFREEERFFREYNLPSAEAHTREHERFIITMKSCMISLERGNRTVATELVYYLASWLSRHIGQEDRVLSRVAARIRAADQP
jgi:hemerythrin